MPAATPSISEVNCRVLAENGLLTATTEPIAVPESDQRSQGRSNVFLTAVLDSGTARCPVRVRNLSRSGALIEASSLPPLGSAVSIVRGELSARGTLAWVDAGHAGISFTGEIDVAAWVKRVGHGGQQRVDGLVAALRSSAPPPNDVQRAAAADSLPQLSAALDKLCEEMAASASMSVELGEQLLKLDWIANALRTIASGSSR